ncbi:MAG TPA: aminoglycoside adenylyltransferase domain-containing protein [Ktedonobacteraceae bacterium]
MSKLFPTPYSKLNRVLQDVVDSVQAVLSTNFVGASLQGSFAVGDFDLHSDVDFIMVTEEELSEEEVHGLQAVHERIYGLDIAWAQHLEGSYFPREVLRDSAHSGGQLWYLDHGSRSLIQSAHCNTVVVRWVVREHGITLAGPAPALLVDPIPVETLREHIMATIQDWGQEILAHPDPYNNRFYQGYIVLSYCRMLHDLHRGFPGSKLAGAEWAKANLDPCWKGLIDRAWNGRPDPAVSVRQRAEPKDFKETLEFVQYSRIKANTLYLEVSRDDTSGT